MRFLHTVVLLAALICAILLPYFVGHGLSAHSTGWILAGIGAGALSAGLIYVQVKMLASDR